MMAVVRNRRAMITGVQAFDAADQGRYHLVEIDYTDGLGAESDQLLWEVEPDADVLEPSALPQVDSTNPMDPREFDAMVRATRWSALTPSLPFSGLDEDRPPMASPFFGAIHVEAFQLVPLLRALEMPRVTMMLADAVGLGKTIQAGMILRELMLRRRIRRVLVLCPASLRSQWREEMDEKFSLPFQLVDRPRQLALQRQIGIDANPWRTHERIIASYHYLKQPDVLEQFRTVAEPGTDGTLRWDLLVVDEVHNLAPSSFGRDSDVSKMLQTIAPWFEHRLFLTATPHNGHTRCFSGLLEALDPVRFTRKSKLDDEDRKRVGQVVVRRLKSEINQQFDPPPFSERHVKALPPLRFGRLERNLQLTFRDFRKEVKRVFRSANASEAIAASFSQEVFQKRLMSGPWAFGQSWLNLLDGLEAETGTAGQVARAKEAQEEDLDDDAERESRQRHADRTVGAWLRPWRDQLSDSLDSVTEAVESIGVQYIEQGLEPKVRLERITKAAPKVRQDVRFKALTDLIDKHLRSGDAWREDERLVIFTEYLASLDYLRARLEDHYEGTNILLTLVGGMNDDDRDAIKKAFNDPNHAVRILIATDAAGEGLNLQRSCRLMLHWDIPWNPARMEQRNGRLDRHGQERDVTIHHFDSTDDASMRFMGKVLRKRSQTREDRVATDELFARAILEHFEMDEDPDEVEERLAQSIAAHEVPDDLPTGDAAPGVADRKRLDELRAEVDLSPETLRDTLETAMAIKTGRPRLEPDGKGRDRLVPPVPVLWDKLIEQTLHLRQKDGSKGPQLAVVFDPEHYVRTRGGRPVFIPEPDSRLLHLGHELYHRVSSTFSRYRYPGGPSSATRWVVREGGAPEGTDALILLTLEELAVNELREPCHHWIRTVRLPVRDEELSDPLPHVTAADMVEATTKGDASQAKDLWLEVEAEIEDFVRDRQKLLTKSLAKRIKDAGKEVTRIEKRRFKRRKTELSKALKGTQLDRLRKEADQVREKTRQLALIRGLDEELARQLADLEAELELRRTHYDQVMKHLAEDEQRTIEGVLPHRYKLRGEARVYPIAVEIRLPGGAS